MKGTKKSLWASGLSLLICCAMLIGVTFAWFTDSVINEKNQITSGKLDVNLAYTTNGTDWNDVEEETNLFKENALWEPGYMEVVYLKIENLGSLALQYRLGMNAVDTVVSTNVLGGELRLSEHLKYAVINLTAMNGNITLYDRAGAKAALEGATTYGLNEAYTAGGTMYPAAAADADYPAEKYIALIVYMPTTVGNEANYQTGEEAPQINLGINLTATQASYEKDGFGNDLYDADVDVFAADLENKLSAGGNVTIVSDVDILPEGSGDGLVPQMLVEADTVLNLGGRTLSVDASIAEQSPSYTPVLISVEKGVTMTIEGDGVITAEAGNNNSYGIDVNGGTLVINDGSFYGAMTAVQVESGRLEINGGFFDLAPTCKAEVPEYARYIVNAIDGAYKAGTAVIEIKGGTFVNFDPSADPEGAGTSYVADGYKVVAEPQANGETWYQVVPQD